MTAVSGQLSAVSKLPETKPGTTSILVCLLATIFLATALVAEAQQPAKIPRIGYLGGTSLPARTTAFQQGLRELGYVEGKNIVIEYRYADGKRERLPDLAAELAHLKVDVIVTTGAVAVLAAKKASPTIPIVFASSSDPVRNGLVSSLAQPGGDYHRT
jgi:putative ABC transport system substrate-binding protein